MSQNFDKKILKTDFQTQNGKNVRHTLIWYNLMITRIFTTSQDFEQYYGNKIHFHVEFPLQLSNKMISKRVLLKNINL